jgi:S1-C subfamily serine protease
LPRYDLLFVEREWDEEPDYPHAPLPAHERTWRHPSEQGATAWIRSEPPLVVGKGLSVATGTVGAVLAIGLLWLMVPHDNRGGGGLAEVSSTVRVGPTAEDLSLRQTTIPVDIVSAPTLTNESNGVSGNGGGTLGGGTTARTLIGTPSTITDSAATGSDVVVTVSRTHPGQTGSNTSPSSVDPVPGATSTTMPADSPTIATKAGGGVPVLVAPVTLPTSGTTVTSSTATAPISVAGPTLPSSPPTSTGTQSTSATPTTQSTSSSQSTIKPQPTTNAGPTFAVALTPGHFVAATAAAVGGQSTVNLRLPTGNTVVGNVVSVDSGSGIAVLSIPRGTPTTPIATSDAAMPSRGATVLNPEPTPVSVFKDSTGTQVTSGQGVPLAEGGLVLDTSKHLIGLCTKSGNGVHVLDAHALLDAINGAIASERPAWLGMNVRVNPTGNLAVTDVNTDGPAAGASIQPGDIIRAVDGTAVSNGDSVRNAVAAHQVGETVVLSVLKTGAATPADVAIVLIANPGSL